MPKRTLGVTAAGVAAAAGAGSLASTAPTRTWYHRLRKPRYVPPSEVFPVAWTALYADMATTSAAAIDRLHAAGRDREARNYACALGVNLAINAGWSWLFFRYHKLGAAAASAALLTASSADLTRRAAVADLRAGLTLSPYPVWCAFATVMSSHIWLLNRRAPRQG